MEKKGLALSIQKLKEGLGLRLASFQAWWKRGWLGLVSVGLMVVVTVGGLFYLATDWNPARPDPDPDFYWAESLDLAEPVEPEEVAELPAPEPTAPAEAVAPEPAPDFQAVAPVLTELEAEAAADPGPEPEEALVPALAREGAFADAVSPVSGTIRSSFGWYQHPVFADWRFNPGADFEVDLGAEVKAVLAGTVVEAKEDDTWGKMLIIDHGGQRRSVYGYLDKIKVEAEEPVEQGQTIATVGKSALTQEPNLHLELRLGGTALDPESYLPVFSPDSG